jgi:alkaline phosphatase D
VLGREQEAWLTRNLQSRDSHWNVLAQQVMMMSLDRRKSADEQPHRVVNLDSWAGYEVPRRRLLNRTAGLNNLVVLTGDEHQNWAGLLHDDATGRSASSSSPPPCRAAATGRTGGSAATISWPAIRS